MSVRAKGIVEFGTGDIGCAVLSAKDGSFYAIGMRTLKDSREIGESWIDEYVQDGITVKDFPFQMIFHNVASVDTMIKLLTEIRAMFKKEK